LYNAVGTNSGSPFVAYPNALAPAEFVDLILEYFVPTRLPVPDPTLLALEVPAFTPGNPAGVPVQISRLLLLAPGTVMLEFGTVPGKSYTVFYSDNPSFTTAHAAQPAIPATADRTQWIDSGPPKTSTPGASRFYRAIENH
jgi:hypothetical protein